MGTREEILEDVRKKLRLTEAEWTSLQDLTDVAKKNVEIYGSDTLEITFSGRLLFLCGGQKDWNINSDFGPNCLKTNKEYFHTTLLARLKITSAASILLASDDDKPFRRGDVISFGMVDEFMLRHLDGAETG